MGSKSNLQESDKPTEGVCCAENYGKVHQRRTYFIFPSTYKVNKNLSDEQTSLKSFIKSDFSPSSLGLHEFTVSSPDFLAQLNEECSSGSLVKAYKSEDGTSFLFFFEGGIALRIVRIDYEETGVNDFYRNLLPGYATDTEESDKNGVHSLIFSKPIMTYAGTEKVKLRFFDYEDEDEFAGPRELTQEEKNLIIKDSYKFNAAFVNKRFSDLEELKKYAYNEHRIIELDRPFEDVSESDIKYAYGVRDVEDEKYRWGCCITSQDVSYVYGFPKGTKEHLLESMDASAENDILLILFALYQRYSCLQLE